MTRQDDPYRLQELAARQEKARAMGEQRHIERQHGRMRLTARERIDKLLDAGTFDELGLLAHSDLPEARERTPADGKITGFGVVNGRTVFVAADDVTVMAGAGGRVGVGKQYKGSTYAARKGFPIIVLGDAGGARVPDIMGSAGMMSMVYPIQGQPRDRQVPQITAIMGECYGGPSWTAAVSDVIIQVKGAVMAVGGPSILEIATGEQATPEALGGWELHATQTGQVDLFAEDETECLWLIRRLLGYLPAHAGELPPVWPAEDPPEARLDNILDVVPANPKESYDMHAVINLIADADSVLEFKPHYDGSLITCLARLDGHVVGFLANNPLVTAGAMGPGACEKATAFICFCDSFHIPLIFLHDTPGFLIGQAAEMRKMPLKIMTFIQALHQSTVPRVSVVIRKSYGMAHCNMAGGNMESDILLAWPTAEVSFVAPEVAVNIVYGRKLNQIQDPDEEASTKEALIEELDRANAPWDAAGANFIDKVIDPRDTRWEIIKALRRARGDNGQKGFSQRRLASWPRFF